MSNYGDLHREPEPVADGAPDPLGYLIVIHKLEYFLNARLVGGQRRFARS